MYFCFILLCPILRLVVHLHWVFYFEQSTPVYHGVQLHLFAIQLHRVLTVGAIKAGVSRGADALSVSGPAGGAVQTLARKSAVLAVQTLRTGCRQFVRQ